MLQINQLNYQKFKLTAILSFAVLFLSGVYFVHPFSFSHPANATTVTTQNGGYYLETTATDLNLTIHTTPAGAQETASHDVTVKTDDPAGYTLSVSVNNDTSNALNLNGNTAATTKFPATGGTYVSPKALDDNSWGFTDTLTKKNNNEWAVVPLLSNAQQLKQTSSTNTTGDTTTMYYAINAKYDGNRSDGNYSNTITYSVVGNTIPTVCGSVPAYTICYEPNGADGGEMQNQTTIGGVYQSFQKAIDASTANEVTLYAQNFYRSGYGFAGWNTKADGSGTQYGPMETIDMSSYSAHGLTLYAKWIASTGDFVGNDGTTWSGCSSLSTRQVTALTDVRDNNTYAVAKLADGNCWMVENLRLGGANAITLNSTTSVTAGTVQASSRNWCDSTNTCYATQQVNAQNTIKNGFSSLRASPYGDESNRTGDYYWYGYGNYYSWAQAIMSTADYSSQYYNASTSLCPKGWRLPSGALSESNNGDFGKLASAMGYDQVPSDGRFESYIVSKEGTRALHTYPYNFVDAGKWSGSVFIWSNFGAFYWTSTNGGLWHPAYFYGDVNQTQYSPGLNSGNNGGKTSGMTVRCLISG